MKTFGILFCWVLFCLSAQGQATFHNLDFGLNRIPPGTPPGLVSASNAIPFWTAYIGNNQQNSVLYNLVSLSAAVTLISPDSPYGADIPGEFAVFLSTGGFGQVSTSIAQTAQFPAWARTLLFVSHAFPGNPWEVTINGLNIPVTEKSQISQGLYLYQGDISDFAGQTDELRFSGLVLPNGDAGGMDVGEIQFSATPVPEPSVLGLLVFGIVCIVFRPRQ